VFFVYTNPTEEIMNLRLQVFVNEQKVPLELELEDDESQFLHICYTKDDIVVATARVGFDSENMTAHIGRVAVSQACRNRGLGKIVMEYTHNLIRICKYKKATLGAQIQAEPFYKKLGYIRYGNQYMDAGIPHINMQINL